MQLLYCPREHSSNLFCNGHIRRLSPEEEARSLRRCGPRLRPIVLTTLHTGLRTSALLSLTWDEVAFRRRMITGAV